MSKGRRSRVLTVDLVDEILLRLPVKDVFRCKLLSKSHHALLNSPGFATKHLMIHQSSNKNNMKSIYVIGANINHERRWIFNRMVSLIDSGVVEEVYVPPPANSAYLLTVAGSCNGLLCLLPLLHQNRNLQTFLLWNPATKDYTVLPATPELGLFPAFGFGYDIANNDYKLVKISGSSCFGAELWNMSTNSWREIEFPNSVSGGLWSFRLSAGVLVRGTLYWLLLSKNYGPPRHAILLSFDLVNNTFRTITSLPGPFVGSRVEVILDFMGFLALSVVTFINSGSRLFDVWVLDDKECSWTKRFSIGPFPERVLMTRVSVNGKFLIKDNNKYFLYDPVNNNREEAQREWLVIGFDTGYTPWSVTESLVSVHKNTEERGGEKLTQC